jgi:Ca-activated chloride channel homolog
MTSHGELARFVEEKAASGVWLTVLGFGMGNLKDATLETLAEKGNGHYGYIDTRREAEKLLVEQVNSTLVTIAKDVKIQVEFNPARVASHRLIGYENRALKTEDFNNDQVDAGEIGAGHTVTALYEIVPIGVDDPGTPVVAAVDERRYRTAMATPRAEKAAAATTAVMNELLTLKVRYKEPAADESKRLEFPLVDSGGRFINASADFKFASALAGFGMILRNSPHKGTVTIGNVIEWAAAGAASADDDPGGHRGEFIDLAQRAQGILRGE